MSCKSFTFYSYKGGSGRTTTLINTTKHLIGALGASSTAPILIVDMDLESAGLTYYFEMEKKFSGLFSDGIHACKFLKFYSTYQKNLLGGAKNFLGKNFDFLLDDLKKNFSAYEIEELFTPDMKLRETEMSIFAKIVSCWAQKRFIDVEKEDALEREEEIKKQRINETYGEKFLKALLDKLTIVQKDNALSDTEKSKKKIEIISEELPASSIVDVSHFFEEEKGTVKFLGVYPSDDEEQVVSNKSLMALRILCNELTKNNYKAVIFDSGAGTQSSAHALHQVSHVVACCMRPSSQFLKGTRLQLSNYEKTILQTAQNLKKGENTKSIIIFPTAVPEEDGDTSALKAMSFSEIKRLAKDFESIVDNTFCSNETCLNEVKLFKWREQILGINDVERTLKDFDKILERLDGQAKTELEKEKKELKVLAEKYSSYKTMPENGKRAYETYKRLAERLVENAKEKI